MNLIFWDKELHHDSVHVFLLLVENLFPFIQHQNAGGFPAVAFLSWWTSTIFKTVAQF